LGINGLSMGYKWEYTDILYVTNDTYPTWMCLKMGAIQKIAIEVGKMMINHGMEWGNPIFRQIQNASDRWKGVSRVLWGLIVVLKQSAAQIRVRGHVDKNSRMNSAMFVPC